MKKISGNKLLVKALQEEGVDTLFAYPGAVPLTSVMNYIAEQYKNHSSKAGNRSCS